MYKGEVYVCLYVFLVISLPNSGMFSLFWEFEALLEIYFPRHSAFWPKLNQTNTNQKYSINHRFLLFWAYRDMLGIKKHVIELKYSVEESEK